MKKIISFLTLILLTSLVNADCSAPELAFEKHDGNILGFKVIKLWEAPDHINPHQDTLVKFGDYDFLISAIETDRQPIKLNIEASRISEKILSNLKRSPSYLYPEGTVLTLYEIEAFDLSGDSKENLILFNVSPGANVYSGAIGVIDGEWKTLVNPICY